MIRKGMRSFVPLLRENGQELSARNGKPSRARGLPPAQARRDLSWPPAERNIVDRCDDVGTLRARPAGRGYCGPAVSGPCDGSQRRDRHDWTKASRTVSRDARRAGISDAATDTALVTPSQASAPAGENRTESGAPN